MLRRIHSRTILKVTILNSMGFGFIERDPKLGLLAVGTGIKGFKNNERDKKLTKKMNELTLLISERRWRWMDGEERWITWLMPRIYSGCEPLPIEETREKWVRFVSTAVILLHSSVKAICKITFAKP